MILNIVVAVDRKWGIGRENKLLFRLKKDMEFFKTTTMGGVVVMGGNTLRSLPGGKPLAARVNVVLTSGHPEGCVTAGSLNDLFETLEKYRDRKIYVIGGASLYRQLLPYCKRAYVTKVDADGGADVFFENLDEKPNWRLMSRGDKTGDGGYNISFDIYENDNIGKYGENL